MSKYIQFYPTFGQFRNSRKVGAVKTLKQFVFAPDRQSSPAQSYTRVTPTTSASPNFGDHVGVGRLGGKTFFILKVKVTRSTDKAYLLCRVMADNSEVTPNVWLPKSQILIHSLDASGNNPGSAFPWYGELHCPSWLAVKNGLVPTGTH